MSDMTTGFHTTTFDTPDARAAAAALPVGERQWMVKRLLVGYPTFRRLLDNIQRLHRPVEGGTHDTGVIGGVLALPRSGKSFACESYWRRNPVRITEGGECHPVVYLQVRDDWTPHHMAEAIYFATGAKSIPRLKTSAMITGAIRRLLEARTELVIVDDAHFAFLGTKGRTLSNYRSIIKGIADTNACNVLLSGLPDLRAFVEADSQIQGRGDFPCWHIEPLRWGMADEREQFSLLLHAIDRRLPFRDLSGLASPRNATHFHRISQGVIGRVMNVVRDAANRAIDAGSSMILEEHLQEAADCRAMPGQDFRPFRDK